MTSILCKRPKYSHAPNCQLNSHRQVYEVKESMDRNLHHPTTNYSCSNQGQMESAQHRSQKLNQYAIISGIYKLLVNSYKKKRHASETFPKIVTRQR